MKWVLLFWTIGGDTEWPRHYDTLKECEIVLAAWEISDESHSGACRNENNWTNALPDLCTLGVYEICVPSPDKQTVKQGRHLKRNGQP